jgi:hypothetical protein
MTISRYTWGFAGILLSLYIYFVGAITFSVMKQQSLSTDTKQLISDMSREEVEYLNAQKGLTEEYATSLGFTKDSNLAFSEAKRAFAWNVGR